MIKNQTWTRLGAICHQLTIMVPSNKEKEPASQKNTTLSLKLIAV